MRSRATSADLPRRTLVAASVGALLLLHQDGWQAADGRLVLGLPVSLLYHAAYCLAAAALMAGLVRWAWPRGVSASPGDGPPEDRPE